MSTPWGRRCVASWRRPVNACRNAKLNFEINAAHPLVGRLDMESDENRFRELTLLLFDQAALADGGQLSDPAANADVS